MAYEDLCMYCFEDMGGESICPHCGRDSRAAVPQVQLLPGTMVYNGRFLIGRALGQDASGIVYAAYDTKRDNKLRIREYLPRDCAERLNDGAVAPTAGMEDQFDAGMRKLHASVQKAEAGKRHFFFEENGTAYIAQRKNAAAAAAGAAAEGGGNRRRLVVILLVALAVLLLAALGLILLFNNLGNTDKKDEDLALNPTLDPQQVWIPVTTPTATPYVRPTFAALVDPELSWLEYSYDGDVEAEYTRQATATPQPTITGSSSNYASVNQNSGTQNVKALQQRLVTLGWLDYSAITGTYDSATRQAVRDFQSYINSAYRANPPLTVDGIAGPKTMQWLEQTNATKPTPTPTPKVTPDPNADRTIDDRSSASQIRSVQRKLITLGLMPAGSADGRYGAETASAVRRFQTRVNQIAGYEVLEITGRMDPLSQSFLNYYAEEWERLRSATAQPTATPTPTIAPTPTPEAEEPSEVDDTTIDRYAEPDSIRRVQQLLINIGMLPAGSADGVYGSGTIAAVAAFQQWVNEQRQEPTLEVTGVVDPLTRLYLEYCDDHELRPNGTPTPPPTETPTPEPTVQIPTDAPTDAPTDGPTDAPTEDPGEEPDENQEITVDRNSDRDSIRYVQQMLAEVGLLNPGGVDGVYGNGTTRAVRAFQEWVNSIEGEGTLPVTGIVDNKTRLALEYYSDHGITVNDTTETPTEAPDDQPTEAPADQPTEAPTEEPTEAPTEAPQVGAVERVDIYIADNSASGDVIAVPEGRFGVSWQAVGDVESFYVYVVDSSDHYIVSQEAIAQTSFTIDASRMTPGEVYTLTVGALPVNGQDEDIVWKSAKFTLPQKATEAPEPVLGTVSAPAITIGGVTAGSSTIVIEQDSFQISWSTSGDVESYTVRITDADGALITEQQDTRQTGLSVRASVMNPGVVYTITVGAKPVNGSEEDIQWSRAQFMLPARETEAPTEVPEEDPTEVPTEAPTPTPEPTPSPAPTVAAIGNPVINIGGSAYQQDGVTYMTDSAIIISWSADGAVDSYYVYVENQAGERQDLGRTNDTSRTINTANLPAGLYTVYVGAMPVNGGSDDVLWSSYRFGIPAPTPEPTEVPTQAPTAEPTPVPVKDDSDMYSSAISASSDSSRIERLQQRLYALGLLSTSGLEQGVLDRNTLQAVADYQQRMNDQYDAGLPVLDPDDPGAVVDTATLRSLFAD